MMNTSKNLGAVELLLLAVLALAWATVTALRLLLVPLLAALIALLTARRRPAPQPAAVASAEAPEAPIAAPEAPALPAVTLASLAAELLELPAAELRKLTGCRRKVAKARMVEAWLAMPI